ncbi:pyridoxamine 5'-phosphate oxidase family protein [Chenggangzhangella methanolivorans]|uniref:Pyridoxamine 5'-phosphate oxidase family protein n=1 Tax=Chenggangzhangella methanolivorans TaxID=1437009 RepID=A0A9E6ULA8_9HYPH|nr:pyridoxamine 5'-phosphate oxidase family protein [Chenggangzhangella methanolivorans]QZN98725.1 pyridoxamine 5'-phosphate oxidase family protein [Chenggangzhangella methanolivorans]
MDGFAPTDIGSPWHKGEIEIQRSAGVVEQMAAVGRRHLLDHLIDQHRAFYPQLPFVAAGAVNPQGDVWATLLAGEPGFLRSPDPLTLAVSTARDPSDPADAGLEDGDAVGLLGIELHTRRRNRLNGIVGRRLPEGFVVEARESFGNCPQYIRLRDFRFVRDPAARSGVTAQTLDTLDDEARAMIAGAETLFVASFADDPDAGRRVDVSHRGGKAGFVRVDADGTLTIPDFAGNNFFNTLGNIRATGTAGLAFVDFETGDMLQLSGDAEVVLDAPEIAAFTGAERLLRVRPRRIVRRLDALPLRWTSRTDGASPNVALTGDWAETARRVEASGRPNEWRRLKVARIVEESATIRSLHLEPADGGAALPHLAGQHLPVRLGAPGDAKKLRRAYTISTAPSDGVLRISVRAQGPGSRRLHALEVGDEIEALAPAGDFTIDARERRPAVMLAAGVGVTPMIAMLRHLVFEGLRTRRTRPTTLFYAARSRAERAFDREIARLVEVAGGAIEVVRLLSDVSDAVEGRDYEVAGRLDLSVVASYAPLADADVYLCGPAGFMQEIRAGLEKLGVAQDRVHAEAFGPAPAVGVPTESVAEGPVEVSFSRAAAARWTPGAGSLLELAESAGLAPPFSCRSGACGSCRARVVSGAVAYSAPPLAPLGPGEALLCVGEPAASGGDRLEIELEA